MKERLQIITTELFHVSLVTYVFFLLADTIREESVSFFFNLDILLGVVLVSGILATLFPHKLSHKTYIPDTAWNRPVTLIISLAGGLLVLSKTFALGWISLVISIAASVLIALLSHLVLQSVPEKNDS